MGPGLPAPASGDGARGRGSRAGSGAAAPGSGEPISARQPIPGTPQAERPVAGVAATGAPIAADPGIAAAFAPEDGSKKKQAFGLSRREIEVLALIAEGRTNREIGERLFISQKTVGVHVGNILAKLGASGRVEAAMVAIRLELVPTPLAARPVLAAG